MNRGEIFCRHLDSSVISRETSEQETSPSKKRTKRYWQWWSTTVKYKRRFHVAVEIMFERVSRDVLSYRGFYKFHAWLLSFTHLSLFFTLAMDNSFPSPRARWRVRWRKGSLVLQIDISFFFRISSSLLSISNECSLLLLIGKHALPRTVDDDDILRSRILIDYD